MSDTIHLDPAQVPQHLRGTYTGNKFRAEVCEQFTIPFDAGLWSGGSRDVFTVVRLADGKTIEPVDHNAAPWDARQSKTIQLEPGIAVVRHSTFMGKDMGLVFHMHPANVAAMLPAPVTLTPAQQAVLNIIDSYISRARPEYFHRAGFTPQQADAIKAELVALGILTKSGATTTKGKNAAQTHRD